MRVPGRRAQRQLSRLNLACMVSSAPHPPSLALRPSACRHRPPAQGFPANGQPQFAAHAYALTNPTDGSGYVIGGLVVLGDTTQGDWSR